MRLSLFSAPTGDVVTTAEAKAFLRYTESDRDTEIDGFLSAAVGRWDGPNGVLGRALLTQTWDMKLDAFPDDGEPIQIPLPPLQSITSITYVDGEGATQTFDSANYAVDVASQPGVISLAYGASWPVTRDQRNAVTIRFVAGYGAAAAVPAPIKDGIKMQVDAKFYQRGEQSLLLADDMVFQFRMLDR